MRNRTKELALRIIKLFQHLPKTDEAKIIGKQLLRSATSVAADCNSASRGRSDAEFYFKICIVVDETDKTLFWLEMLQDAKNMTETKLSSLNKEVTEILSIFSKTIATIKKK